MAMNLKTVNYPSFEEVEKVGFRRSKVENAFYKMQIDKIAVRDRGRWMRRIAIVLLPRYRGKMWAYPLTPEGYENARARFEWETMRQIRQMVSDEQLSIEDAKIEN